MVNLNCPEEQKIAIYRFLRVVFGLTSSPFLLNGTIRHHLGKYTDQEFVERFLEDLYVDGTTSGCNTYEQGVCFHDKAVSMMNEGGFCLTLLRLGFFYPLRTGGEGHIVPQLPLPLRNFSCA